MKTKIFSWFKKHQFDIKFMSIIVIIVMLFVIGLSSASAQECTQTWTRMDTTNSGYIKDFQVFKEIFVALDSVSKTDNFVTINDGTKRFDISAGEFMQMTTNPKKFVGTILLDRFEVSEKSIIYHSFSKNADFQVSMEMCWHQAKSAGEYPNKKMMKLLASIRKR